MTRILFRCDASFLIGSGHIIRCRTLARELELQGAEVIFLCRPQPGDLISLLENEFRVLKLPYLHLSRSKGLEGRKLYESWLGCSQLEDANDCLNTLSSAGIHNIDWLVVDHYGLDIHWETELKNGFTLDDPFKLLVIDDLADRSHQADLLLDQNFVGPNTEERYQNYVPSNCLQLLGPHYSLLAPEYARLHLLVPTRAEVRRLLVFFGGVDHNNLTGRTIKALMNPALSHLSVDIVLGSQSPHRKAVEDQAAQRPYTNIHFGLPSLAGLIARADLAIGACGTTTWERACLKLPSLVVTIADNQKLFAKLLSNEGHIRLIGDANSINTEDICSELLRSISETEHHYKNAGGNLTDGNGTSRVAIAMLGPKTPIKLRPADEGDEALLLRWANDTQVRSNSFSTEQIKPSVHHKWFLKGLTDSNRILLIASTKNNIPIGQIRFDRQPILSKRGMYEAVVDLSIDRCARGHGLATEIVQQGLCAKNKHWGADTEAVAEVMKSNDASNSCFRRCGFSNEQVSIDTKVSPNVNRWRKA